MLSTPLPRPSPVLLPLALWGREGNVFYRVRLQGAGNDYLQNVTCFGCGEKGHFKDKCPKAGNQQNDRARGRAYVVVENPQQNPKCCSIKTGLPKLEEHNFERKLLSDEKFCLLKARVKQWHSETKTLDRVTKHDNLQLIKSIEEKIEAGTVNDNDRDSRIKLLQEVDRLDTLESFDLFQKARVK
ncbi:RNA-directed DNA polymerase, eukaryota, reverse transcriptase zinc-binding domain protein [Tanacetum coccineum]|uniref:RNA-directed DNA polymerase, eukaryota, reverse transcriptase zinc-binding domain protein n=1 Tax=Tanacetum coccineum TaxID=301880 RepID=A0ABQ5AKJ5_9ASTR